MNRAETSQKIKIFIFIDSYRIGGMHRQMLYLVDGINKNKFEPIVCVSSDKGGLKEKFVNTRCKLVSLDWKGRYDLGIILRLFRVLKNVSPDIVFITEAQNLFYFRLSKLFWNKNVVQIGSFRALSFWLGYNKKRYHFIDNIFSKWLYKSSDYVTVNSETLKIHYSKIVNLKVEKPIRTIYNGCDFNFKTTKSNFEIRNELKIPLSDIIIIMIARLDPWKDFDTLLITAKKLVKVKNNVKFILVGDGLLKEDLNTRIINDDLIGKVLLLGEKKDVFNYLSAADISILTTHGEGFSNSILESMAFSKPVIASNVGGNIELIGDSGEFGILVPPKSNEKLYDSIISLLNDEKKRIKIGNEGRKRINKLCNIDKYISEYENLFISSINRK